MDTRERADLIDTRTEVIPTACGHPGHSPVNVQFLWPSYKRTFEVTSTNSTKDKHVWKDFEHYKRSVTTPTRVAWTGAVDTHVFTDISRKYDSCTSSDPYAWSCNEFGTPGEYLDGLSDWYDPTLENGTRFIVPPSGLNELRNASYRSMLPLIKSELSSINSLIELKDFRSLPHTQARLRNFITSLPKGWRNAKKQTLRELFRTGSDGYLQLSFNFLPLASDIADLFKAIQRTKARVNELIAGQGSFRRRHYRRLLVSDDTSVESKDYFTAGWVSNYPTSVKSEATRYVYTDVNTFHAEIEYNYNFTQYQVEHAQLLGLLDALGVNLNPAIIWNAIKFSFIIDWLINVSKWLNDRRVLNMEPVINIHNYLWSVTRRRRILVYRNLRRNSVYHDIGANETVLEPGGPLPVVTESAYRRQVELPTSSLITTSGLSLKEFSLGAALVLVRGKRHKHKG